MKTLDFLKERSRERGFPLQICTAGLLTALGGPLVVVPVLGIVATDALIAGMNAAPRAFNKSLTVPSRWIGSFLKAVATRAEERRIQAEREAEASRMEQEDAERMSRSEITAIDARLEVVRFYEANRLFLEDALPPSLFRSQLQTRFPSTTGGDQAWQTTRDMITEMLPTVASGRERQRAAGAEQRKRDEEAAAVEKAKRDEENSRHAIGRLTQWYEREKARIVELMPECPERDIILQQLYERFDQLIKESILEMKP